MDRRVQNRGGKEERISRMHWREEFHIGKAGQEAGEREEEEGEDKESDYFRRVAYVSNRSSTHAEVFFKDTS
jgi:hypothetical protein